MTKFSEISPCPVCQNRHFKRLFNKKGRDFWQCACCGLQKLYPLPTLEELGRYYDESYTNGLYRTFIEARRMKQATAQQRLTEILPYCPPGHWLDVGCSDGMFISVARQNGLNAEGIDLSEIAIEEASKLDLPVFRSTIEEYDPGYRFNTITAFDVLEHVLSPAAFLQSVYRLLAPKGRVALSVPNQASLICQIMGKYWYFYIPEEHLHYFNPRTITQLFLRVGFKVERCVRTYKPLTFSYSLTQFREYNPLIYTLLNMVSAITPKSLHDKIIPLHIGEMMVIGERLEVTS